jgi:hypothetical protein
VSPWCTATFMSETDDNSKTVHFWKTGDPRPKLPRGYPGMIFGVDLAASTRQMMESMADGSFGSDDTSGPVPDEWFRPRP